MTRYQVPLLDRLREPAYTGENRCIPCTLANTAIAAAIAGVLWVAWRPSVAAVAFVVFLLAIYLRGYLVPGTPTLTKRYFPDAVLALFDPPQGPGVEDPPADLETILHDAGILEPCPDREDLCLSEDFKWEWHEEIDHVRSRDLSRDILADLLGVESTAIHFQRHGEAYVLFVENQRVGTWESEAAFYADVAGATIIPEWTANWGALAPETRSSLLAGLRLFLENCPACGGVVELGEDTVESCCRTIEVFAVTCTDCGSRLLEVEQPEQLALA
jgi:hypothetical protein